jgi:hypothetical protein
VNWKWVVGELRNATFTVGTERILSALKVIRMYPLAVLVKGS